ncbi:hypothetical protein [Methylobacillus glycogenes]|uniref:hypothetical protein n=1 Tax=Methylobacillus glycogenes TaxID=406 RepID=UPI0009DF985C|nr:hypothetical protein [Methylobacillus glycogenes]
MKITRQEGDTHRFTIADRDGATAVKALYQNTQSGKQGEIIFDENSLMQKPTAEEVSIIESFPTGRVHRISKLYSTKSGAIRQAREKFRELKRGSLVFTAVVAQYRRAGSGTIATVIMTEKHLNTPEKIEEKDIYILPSIQASAANMKVLRHIYSNRTNAVRAAESEYKRMLRGIATFSIHLAKGRAEIYPELQADITGWKSAIDSSKWIVARVVHSLTNLGFTTNLDLEIKT